MFEKITSTLESHPFIYENIKFVLVFTFAYASYLLTKVILFKGIHRFIQKTKTKIDDILLNDKLLKKLSLIAPLLVIHQFSYLLPSIEEILTRIVEACILFLVIQSVTITLNSFNTFYEQTEKYKERPIKGYIQIVTIFIYIIGFIFLVGLLTGQDPWAILGGIGAMTAVLMLIFKDTILSFVASIQITSYDLVNVDDWIEVPSLGVDGDVMDIALHTIKVRNFDKTITVIPTHKLIEVSFKNWRGMQQAGGRRIKRAIYIDLDSVKFCDLKMLERFEKFNVLKEYLAKKKVEIEEHNKSLGLESDEVSNGRKLTNVGTFRAYLKEYLRNRKDINENFTFLVRQLPAGPDGLPIEIYVFANTTQWVPYEEIQADIFDHLFAVLPEFELRMFQHPTGNDFKN